MTMTVRKMVDCLLNSVADDRRPKNGTATSVQDCKRDKSARSDVHGYAWNWHYAKAGSNNRKCAYVDQSVPTHTPPPCSSVSHMKTALRSERYHGRQSLPANARCPQRLHLPPPSTYRTGRWPCPLRWRRESSLAEFVLLAKRRARQGNHTRGSGKGYRIWGGILEPDESFYSLEPRQDVHTEWALQERHTQGQGCACRHGRSDITGSEIAQVWKAGKSKGTRATHHTRHRRNTRLAGGQHKTTHQETNKNKRCTETNSEWLF